MKHFTKILQVLIATLIVTGCSDEKDILTNPESNLVIESLDISVEGVTGQLEVGALPFSDRSENPSLISFPDAIKSAKSRLERIDLVFEVESSIEEVYFSIEGSSKYYVFSKNDLTIDSNRQGVSLLIDIPESIESNNFCALVSVKDGNQKLSDQIEICIELDENFVEERLIYFADFSGNSTLSTLNFNSGEVTDIGLTGFSLSDIAFLDDQLYGVNLDSQLILIDTDTGQGQLIGDIGFFNVNALEGSNGVLYGATRNGEFLTINPTNGQGNLISLFDSNAVSSGDLVFDATQNLLYGTLVLPNSSTDVLTTIDSMTGATNFIGETNYTEVWGLALLRNQLIGLTTSGDFIIIDESNGQATFIENTDAFSAGGAAAIRVLNE